MLDCPAPDCHAGIGLLCEEPVSIFTFAGEMGWHCRDGIIACSPEHLDQAIAAGAPAWGITVNGDAVQVDAQIRNVTVDTAGIHVDIDVHATPEPAGSYFEPVNLAPNRPYWECAAPTCMAVITYDSGPRGSSSPRDLLAAAGWVTDGRLNACSHEHLADARREHLRCDIAEQVDDELDAQDAKWGADRNLPDGTGSPWFALSAKAAKDRTDRHAKAGTLTWHHILAEEFFEAIAETDSAKLRTELIQVAAVAQQWAAAIDRREALAAEATEITQTEPAVSDPCTRCGADETHLTLDHQPPPAGHSVMAPAGPPSEPTDANGGPALGSNVWFDEIDTGLRHPFAPRPGLRLADLIAKHASAIGLPVVRWQQDAIRALAARDEEQARADALAATLNTSGSRCEEHAPMTLPPSGAERFGIAAARAATHIVDLPHGAYVTITAGRVDVQVGHGMPDRDRRLAVAQTALAIDRSETWDATVDRWNVLDDDAAGAIHRRRTIDDIEWDVWAPLYATATVDRAEAAVRALITMPTSAVRDADGRP
jgi:hypothetical protein